MLRHALILALVFIFSPFTFAADKVVEVEVNGFRVYLVDMEKGNQFAYTFSVPYGSADDEPKYFGRAHFFEHMFSRGSKRFPGHETLIEAMSGFGYERNAGTGNSYTMYYGSGNEEHAIEAMTMHLASIEEPQLEASSLVREKATVVNEIVNSAPSRPIRALMALPFMILPQDGHPARGHFVGTNETLDPMSADDLRDLHSRIYHAGNVKLAIFANFTSGSLKRDRIVQELEKILPKSSEPKSAYSPAAQAPVFEEDRVVQIESSNDRVGSLLLPIAEGSDIAAVNAFLDMLTNSYRNGLLDQAQRQLGWLTGLSAGAERIGPHHFAHISFRMTEEGYSRQAELVQWILESLIRYQTEAFPEPVLKQHRESILKSYRTLESDMSGLKSNFSIWMTEAQSQAELHFDWEAVAARYTGENLMKGAQALRFKGKSIAHMGPQMGSRSGKNGDTLSRDPFYDVNYSIEAWREPAIHTKTLSPQSIEVPKVDLLEVSKSGPLLQKNDWSDTPGWIVIHAHKPEWTERTVVVRLQFGQLSALEQLSLNTWVAAVNEQLRPEMATLQAKGVELSVTSSGGEISIFANGKEGLELVSIEWLLGQLHDFVPDEKVIERLKQGASLALQRTEEGFPGQVTVEMVRSLFSQRQTGPLVVAPVVRDVSAKSISDFVTKILPRSHKTLAIVGSFRPSEEEQLRSAVTALSPQSFAYPPTHSFDTYKLAEALDYKEGWRKPGQNNVGIMRVFNGPPESNIREQAAMTLVFELMSEQIFLRNRPLGYMQGASVIPFSVWAQHLAFYGQANQLSELPQLQSVWEEELSRWRRHEVDGAAIEKIRKGTIAQLSEEPNSSKEAFNVLSQSLRTSGDPFRTKKLLEVVKTLTHEEIYAAVDKYLGGDQPTLTVTKGGDFEDCSGFLQKRTELRARFQAVKIQSEEH